MKHPKAPKLPNDGRKRQYLWRIDGCPCDVGLPIVDVSHDDWCGISQGKPWNCTPDITLRRQLCQAPRTEERHPWSN